MSKIVIKLPQDQEPLRWWRLRLEMNECQHIMVQHFDNVDNPTEVVCEFFDGHDTVLENVTQVEMDGRYLHVLSRSQPTPCERWIPGETVELPDPDWVRSRLPDHY